MIPLVAPRYTDLDREAVARASQHLDNDPRPALEEELANRFQAAACRLTPSGTAAIHLALLAIGIGPGDIVLAPSYTCVAVQTAILMTGADVKLCDNHFDPARGDFNMSPSGPDWNNVACVIVPHAFGVPATIRPSVPSDVAVIEDVTMCLGATLENGEPVGRSSDVTVASFHESKLISAGAGGAVFANSRNMAAAVDRVNGLDEFQRNARTGSFDRTCPVITNYEMPALSAVLCRSQLAQLDSFLARRTRIARAFDDEFRTAGISTPVRPVGSVVFRYIVTVDVEVPNLLGRFAERSIEAGRGVYPALHQLRGEDTWSGTNAQRAIDHNFSIPVHPALSDSDVEMICAAIRSEFR